MLFPIIPTRIHGILDYIYAIALIALPWIYEFSVYTYAPWLMLILGVCIIIFSLMTRYERGYVGLISMRTHLWLDILVGILLIVGPYLLNFEHHVTLPHQVMGAIAIVVALLTQTTATSAPNPRLTPQRPRK